jgi:hypothetical protein
MERYRVQAAKRYVASHLAVTLGHVSTLPVSDGSGGYDNHPLTTHTLLVTINEPKRYLRCE